MNERLNSDSKAVEFFKRYTPKITLERQAEYTLNAKVLNAMKAKEADMTCRHSTCGFRNKKLVRNTLLALCEHLGSDTGTHCLEVHRVCWKNSMHTNSMAIRYL